MRSKIIIIGLPYFAKKIAKNLSKTDSNHSYLAIDPSAGGVWQKICFIWHLISAKTLYQIGGATQCGRALRLAKLLNTKIVMHWVGTDVLIAQADYAAGEVDVDLIQRTMHLCEVDWIRAELLDLGIQAEIAQIACIENELTSLPHLPPRFSILSYMGKGREKFYGIDKLVELAKAFPEIPIRIAGISEYSETLPENIQLLGWVQNMEEEYLRCVLYLRLPEHDGLAFSVLEALLHGRYVGYTYAFPNANKTPDRKSLHDLVDSLQRRFSENSLNANLDGQRFILNNYSRRVVMQTLSELIANDSPSLEMRK